MRFASGPRSPSWGLSRPVRPCRPNSFASSLVLLQGRLRFSAGSSTFSFLVYEVQTCPIGRRFAFNGFVVFVSAHRTPPPHPPPSERALGKGQVCRGLFGAAPLRAPTAPGSAVPPGGDTGEQRGAGGGSGYTGDLPAPGASGAGEAAAPGG